MTVPIWSVFIHLLTSLLLFLGTLTGNLGLAIIVQAIIIRLLLTPFVAASVRSARRMQALPQRLRELEHRYGDDRQRLWEEMKRLYQEHRAYPQIGCLPVLAQIPLVVGLYYATLAVTTLPPQAEPGFGTHFLWISSLAQPDPFYILPVLVTLTQFIGQRLTLPSQSTRDLPHLANVMSLLPLLLGLLSWNVAAGPLLYWIAQNIVGAVQQYLLAAGAAR